MGYADRPKRGAGLKCAGWFLCLLALVVLSASNVSEAGSKPATQAAGKVPAFKDAARIPRLVAQGAVRASDIPDPHWRTDGCDACHKGRPTKERLRLRTRDYNRLCNDCHGIVSPHSYIHPVGMTVPEAMQRRMPRDFRRALQRSGGKLSCIVCHDLPITCLKERAAEKGLNPLFFRGGPFRGRTDLCYKCHDSSRYKRLNPHDQLTKSGKIRKEKCRVCHTDKPDPLEAKNIDQVGFNEEVDLSRMCTGCHPWRPHPGGDFKFLGKGGPNHLVLPSGKVLRWMKKMEKKSGVIFPLDPTTGKIFCGTCHDSHDKGVVRTAAGRGPGAKHRLRLRKICVQCHEK